MKANLEPLSDEDLAPLKLVMETAKKSLGFIPNSLRTMARNPAIASSFGILTGNILGKPGAVSPLSGLKMGIKNMMWTGKNMGQKNRAPHELRSLVAYASSVASGCRYCQAHAIGAAHKNGTSIEKIEAFGDFENSPLFDEAERAVLRFGLAAGQVPNAVTAEHFSELKKHFSEDQIVDLGATIALFGFLNRWNDTFATQLEPEAITLAEKHLSKSGWTIGKHGDA